MDGGESGQVFVARVLADEVGEGELRHALRRRRGGLGKVGRARATIAEGYVGAMAEHSKSVLDELPESYRDLDKENSGGEETRETSKMIPRPDLDGFVFFRIRTDMPSYQPGERPRR